MIYLPDFRHLVQSKYRTGYDIKLVVNTNTSYVAKNVFHTLRIHMKIKYLFQYIEISLFYICWILMLNNELFISRIPDMTIELVYVQDILFWLNTRKIFANELNILARLLNYRIQDKELFIVSTRQLFFCYIYRQCYWWWNKPVSYTL